MSGAAQMPRACLQWRRATRAGRRGVTLIEVLVALGLAAGLLGAVIVFVHDLMESRERIERRSTRDRAIDAFMDVFETAVATSVLDSGDAAFVGDAASCTIQSCSVDAAQSIADDGRPFNPATVTWCGFDQSAGALLVRRGTGAVESLPAEASNFRLRYHDGHEWVDAFDAREAGRLPTAIEVRVWLSSPADPSTEEESGNAAPLSPPDRRRLIAVPDSAPAELLPAASRRST